MFRAFVAGQRCIPIVKCLILFKTHFFLKSYLLVTGGEGYLGTHLVHYLLRKGHAVVSLGRTAPSVLPTHRVIGDVGNKTLLRTLFRQYRFDAVFHLAGSSRPAESLSEPVQTYANNVANTLTLLTAMKESGVPRIVFPSSAAIFGETTAQSIDEQHPLAPQTPYASSKAMIESLMADYDLACNLRYACLRLFNPAGCQENISSPFRATLIPALMRAFIGQEEFPLYQGYDTPDGSSIRDFVHITDTYTALYQSYCHLVRTEQSFTLNIGAGVGTSVRELIARTETLLEGVLPIRTRPRRPGDPAKLIANVDCAKQLIGWQAQRDSIDAILLSAWHQEKIRTGRGQDEDNLRVC